MKTFFQNTLVRYIAVLLGGLFLGWLLFRGSGHSSSSRATAHGAGSGNDHHGHHEHDYPEMAQGDGVEETIWTCSMHPQIRQAEFGICPLCGMDLTPAAAGGAGDEFTLVMTAEAVAMSQIQTSPVAYEIPVRELRLPGRVAIDETRESVITAHFDGRITEQKVAVTGEQVRQGDVLGRIWSPELVTAQQELLDAARMQTVNPGLLDAARRRMTFWGLSEAQVEDILTSGQVRREVEILAPRSGVVTRRAVREQDYVRQGTVLYEIADLSRVWIDFEAFERDVAWLATGDVVRFTAAAFPGEVFAGRVSWVDPVMDARRRVVRVRVEAGNTEGRWRPEMLVSGEVLAEGRGARVRALTVPASAVLWTGTRSLVYVQVPGEQVPTFESREVRLGERFSDRWIVLEGLDVGERVVSNGVFTVDAEFQLRDKFSMMNRDRVPVMGAALRRAPERERDEDDGGSQPAAASVHSALTPSAAITSTGTSATSPSAGTSGTGISSTSGTTIGTAQNNQTSATSSTSAASNAATDTRSAVTRSFRSEFSAVLDAYMEAKDALVASDAQTASRAASLLRDRINALSEQELLSAQAQSDWLGTRETLRREMINWLRSENIEHQRTTLYAVSRLLFDAAQQFGVEGVVYQQYCPMAFNDTGASWLSRENRIMNPYLPETMLGCGEVLTIIN
jgi:membrane fusion protein, copper/silver efflux system